jgi:prophage tail gpP-like protein
LEVSEQVGGITTLELIHQHLQGGAHLSPGQRLMLRQETVNIFLGTIDTLEEVLVSGNVALFTRVEAVDLSAIPERRMVTVDTSYVSQLAGVIVKDLVTIYLGMEGITVNSVQNGPTIANFTINAFTSVADALRDLSDLTGFVWFVDAAGDLHFEAQTQAQAPFDISATAGAGVEVPLDSVTVNQTRERYRNRQTVRYGADLALSVTVNDTAQQAARAAVEGGTGIYHAVEDADEILAAGEATALADALLRRFGKIPQTVQFATRVRGLKAGQTVTVTLPKHGIGTGSPPGTDFLIDKVTLRDEGNQILRWDVTAVSGEHFADSMEFWRHLAGK